MVRCFPMPRVMSRLVASHGRAAYTPAGARSCRGGELLGGKKGLRTMPPTDEVIRLARLQAIFYIVTGVWPFVSMRSFEAVTGPKVDRWLVKTVGALVAVIGCALAFGSRRQQLAPELVLVAAGSAAALATIDTVYVARRRISAVYLLDAAAEIALVAAWGRCWWRSPRR
jgi:hypothetical protein